jgi:hypothetical protein
VVDAAGCSIVQHCPCAGPPGGGAWRNHGQFLRCVVEKARELREAGRLSPKQAGAIVSGQARRDCGRHGRADRD